MSGYLDHLLVPGESVLHLARRSAIVTFAAPAAALAGGLAAASALLWLGQGAAVHPWLLWGGAAVLVLVPLGFVAARFIWWKHKLYVVTGLRVLKLEGILSKSHRDASLDKINDLGLQQGVAGRLLGFGDLQILTANETSGVTYHWLSDPVGFKRHVLQAREASLGGGDPIAQLERLGELRSRGIVTEAEFEAKKKELLGRIR